MATNANTGSNSYYLNGGYAGQIGLAKSLSVMPGDAVSIQAYAKYSTPSGTASNFTSFISSLLTAFNLTAPAPGEVGTPAAGVNTFGNWEIGTAGDENKSDAMKIFVTIIMYDRNYNFLDVTYQAVQGSGSSMTATYTAKQPGYAYLYISNEHPYLTDVYFDDVTVTFKPSPVVQQEDFYPFGLSFNKFQRENTVPNNLKLFQGQEHVDDLGLNWDQFKWRNHQPDIGRFFNVDPLADKYVYNSPYAFSENKVVAHVEVEGLESENYQIKLQLDNKGFTGYFGIQFQEKPDAEAGKGLPSGMAGQVGFSKNGLKASTTNRSLIPGAIHQTKSMSTRHIERFNLNLRTHLKRLSRKTICFSKSKEMLEACLKIYCWRDEWRLQKG